MKGKKLAELFFTFVKIGLFTFGGGYAMISIIENICVDQKKWLTHDDMMNVTVVAESTPGPIAINCATYVGYCQAGFLGAVVTTMGVVMPSFVIIYAISMFFNQFLEIAVIANAFKGIKIGVSILIINAGLNMLKKVKKAPLSWGIVGCSFAAMLLINIFSWNFSSISLMLIAGAVSLAVFAAREKGGAV